MLLDAAYFQLLTGTQVHESFDSLGFYDNVSFFLPVLGQIDRPVVVLGVDCNFNREAVWNLAEHFDIGIVFRDNGKGTFNGAAIIDKLIIDTVLHQNRFATVFTAFFWRSCFLMFYVLISENAN